MRIFLLFCFSAGIGSSLSGQRFVDSVAVVQLVKLNCVLKDSVSKKPLPYYPVVIFCGTTAITRTMKGDNGRTFTVDTMYSDANGKLSAVVPCNSPGALTIKACRGNDITHAADRRTKKKWGKLNDPFSDLRSRLRHREVSETVFVARRKSIRLIPVQ